MGYKVEKSVECAETGRVTTETIEITDGWWVVRIQTYVITEEEWDGGDGDSMRRTSYCRSYLIVGPGPHKEILLRRQRDNPHYTRFGHYSDLLLVGDQPFGVALQKSENGQMVGGQYFVCARQIHKSELGRRPEIQHPRFAREAPLSDAKISFSTRQPISARNQRRGKKGWARVAEVAKLAQMNPGDMLAAFLPFTDTEHPRLDLLMGRKAEEIIGRVIKTSDITRFNADELDELRLIEPTTAWMRKGLALAILYLRHFGYTPEPIAKEAVTAA